MVPIPFAIVVCAKDIAELFFAQVPCFFSCGFNRIYYGFDPFLRITTLRGLRVNDLKLDWVEIGLARNRATGECLPDGGFPTHAGMRSRLGKLSDCGVYTVIAQRAPELKVFRRAFRLTANPCDVLSPFAS